MSTKSCYCSKHSSAETNDTDTKCQYQAKEKIDYKKFNKAFGDRVKNALADWISYLNEEGRPAPSDSTVAEYHKTIVHKSMNDKEYYRMIREDGSPDGWNNGWIREFVEAHSDFYNKWTLE